MDTLEQLCGVTSVWSVDLAYLLHRLGVPTSYCTTCLGANQDHKTNVSGGLACGFGASTARSYTALIRACRF